MDESKLSKSDANRKPLEFLLKVEPDSGSMVFVFDCTELAQAKQDTRFREVLPQDDSIRVSREDLNILLKEIKTIKRKNGPAVNSAHNVTLAEELLERIKRESRGEG